MAHAEAEDEARQRDRPSRLDGGEQIGDAQLSRPFPVLQLLQVRPVADLEREDIRRLPDQPVVKESGELLVAQTLDVEGAAGDEVLEVLDLLKGTGELPAASPHDRLRAGGGCFLGHRGLQHTGTDGREVVRRGVCGTLLQHHADDLGDHVARALDDHRVADAHVLAGDLLGVVQGCVAHDHAADCDRGKFGHRRQGARAADLDLDVEQGRARLLRRKLVRNGPPGRAADSAEARLPVQPVELVDHPVDVVAEPRTFRLKGLVDRDQPLDVRHLQGAGVDRKAPVPKPLQRLVLRLGEGGAQLPPGIGEEAQGPLGRHRRIDLSQRARRRVARIGVEPLACSFGLGVHGGKGVSGDVDLAAHLDPLGPDLAEESPGNVVDGQQVGGDILTRSSITPRRPAHEASALVEETRRQPVHLRLGGELKRPVIKSEEAPDSLHEIFDVLRRERIVEAQHRRAVRDGGKGLGRRSPYAVRDRICADQVWKPRLDGEVAALQGVVIRVGDLRRVLLVIEGVVAGELFGEARKFGLRLRCVQLVDFDHGGLRFSRR